MTVGATGIRSMIPADWQAHVDVTCLHSVYSHVNLIQWIQWIQWKCPSAHLAEIESSIWLKCTEPCVCCVCGNSFSWFVLLDSGKLISGLLIIYSHWSHFLGFFFSSPFRRTLKNPSAFSVHVLSAATLPLRHGSTAQQHPAPSVWCVQGHVDGLSQHGSP